MPSDLKNIVITGFAHRLGGGGGNAHIHNLVPMWESFGVKVSILDLVNVDKFSLSTIIKSTLQSLFVKIDNLHEINKCDIILSESPYPPDIILAFRLSRRYIKPVTVYVHHVTPHLSIYPFRRGFFRVLLNLAYISFVLFFVSKFSIPIFLDNPNTLEQTNIIVFPDFDAIKNKQLNYTPAVIRLDKECDICYIGRIENHKGVEDIIRVAEVLKNKYLMNLKIVLAGNGKDKYVAKIKKMIKRLGLSEIVLLKGYVSEEQKFELLRNSRLFLFLSYEEGWSISVMEAANVGIPIVAYSLPAYYYLQGNYFPIELGNIQHCAETVKQIIDDNASATEKAIKAKECVDKFSYEFIAKQQLIFFEKIANNHWVNHKR